MIIYNSKYAFNKFENTVKIRKNSLVNFQESQIFRKHTRVTLIHKVTLLIPLKEKSLCSFTWNYIVMMYIYHGNSELSILLIGEFRKDFLFKVYNKYSMQLFSLFYITYQRSFFQFPTTIIHWNKLKLYVLRILNS